MRDAITRTVLESSVESLSYRGTTLQYGEADPTDVAFYTLQLDCAATAPTSFRHGAARYCGYLCSNLGIWNHQPERDEETVFKSRGIE